jgi:hypothetical protein
LLRYGLRAFHITLVAACLYLLYGVVSAFLGTSELAEPVIPDVEALPPSEVDFLPYQIVGERNLFESRDVALPPPPPPEEKLKESKLQLRLIGTIAGTSRALSWATVENEKTKEHVHVTIGDQLGETPDIKVARIERKKLVVDNKGQFEAITMEEPETTTKPRPTKTRPKARRRPRRRGDAPRPSPQPRAVLRASASASSSAYGASPTTRAGRSSPAEHTGPPKRSTRKPAPKSRACSSRCASHPALAATANSMASRSRRCSLAPRSRTPACSPGT